MCFLGYRPKFGPDPFCFCDLRAQTATVFCRVGFLIRPKVRRCPLAGPRPASSAKHSNVIRDNRDSLAGRFRVGLVLDLAGLVLDLAGLECPGSCYRRSSLGAGFKGMARLCRAWRKNHGDQQFNLAPRRCCTRGRGAMERGAGREHRRTKRFGSCRPHLNSSTALPLPAVTCRYLPYVQIPASPSPAYLCRANESSEYR